MRKFSMKRFKKAKRLARAHDSYSKFSIEQVFIISLWTHLLNKNSKCITSANKA